jgi:hypothetical protein
MSSSQQKFVISKDRYLFFDIFYKEHSVYMIMPMYNEKVSSNEIIVQTNNSELTLTSEYVKNLYEPIVIFVYSYTCTTDTINLTVQYKDLINSYLLDNIVVSDIKIPLSLTTLFKNDYKVFPMFYNYYKNQGVSHFYMYYNGIVTDEITKIFNFDDVTLIEWDFNYWNDETCKYTHHAQLGQIHHALYKYGKNVSDYMIFCDLDEYLHIPNITLYQCLLDNPDVDIFGFQNRWSITYDGKIPDMFPNTFLSSEKIKYKDRSKNIYKVNTIDTLGIHHPSKKTNNIKIGFDMFHFYNWGDKVRKIDCNIPIELK